MTSKHPADKATGKKAAKTVGQTLIQKSNIHETLFRQLPIGVIYQGNNGRIKFANPAAEEILGVDEADLENVTVDNMPWKVFHKDGRPMALDEHPNMQTLRTGVAVRGAVMCLEKEDGTRIWIKINAEIVADSDTGQQVGVITSFSDITDERNVNVALQSLTDRSQVAIDSAEMGVWDWIPNESLMIWDYRLYEMHGYPDDAKINARDAWEKSMHPEDKERVNKALTDLSQNGVGNQRIEYRVIWHDGSTHHIRAQARVMKNANDDVLRVIGVAQDVTKDIQAEKKLWELAYTDALTGAYSRAGLAFRMSRSVVRANKSKGSFCVMMIGLSRFKEINDNYGISIGDKVLIEIARRVKTLMKEEDSLVRAGGDEFIVVMENVSSNEQVEQFSKDFRETVLEPIFLEQGIIINIDASVGVSFYPQNGRDAITLQTRAGLAMHQAKADKSEQFVFYNAQMSDSIRRKYNLKYQLRNAIMAEELQLYYQPIVDLEANDRVVGCEALIRWKDADGNFVSPVEFIPIAEESGLIYDLGQWINLTAIKQWKLWQALSPSMQYISINVSPHQLEKPEFTSDLVNLLKEHDVKPENIQLEITEGTFLKESLNADSTLKNLADLGFRLAIDDFGTGYSSLAYLKRFNVDVIKIDRSFIRDIETDQSDRDIVSAILAMNKKLGFKTLVEGVETEKQNQLVKELGCQSGQGYLYGRPTFADEFAENYIWPNKATDNKKAV
ncbi:putative signaling protein [Thalassocella blandensis]|nr:putative signaling protein [Thalassocella blandensis]